MFKNKLKINENILDNKNSFNYGKKSMTNILNLTEKYTPLMEGVFHTYPIEKVRDYFLRYYGLDQKQVLIAKGENGELGLTLIIPPNDEAKNEIEKSLKLCGYYISYIERFKYYWKVESEKNKTKDINDKIRDIKKIYHVTPKHNVDQIKKIGLCPKTKNKLFSYPDRIYFSLSPNNVRGIKNALKEYEKLNNPDDYDENGIYLYGLLEIDKEHLPESIKFYYDINAENCVYTTDNIPPQYIKLITFI